MSDILTEYTQRHGLPKSIHPLTEGLVFFEHNNKKFIVLISSVSKSFVFCKECANNHGSIILEVLTFDRYDYNLNPLAHIHYTNEFDIINECKKIIHKDCKPIAINSTRELEEFVWNLYVEILNKTHQNFLKQRKNWVDEMLFMSMKQSGIFERYYMNLYSPLLINRKYLYK